MTDRDPTLENGDEPVTEMSCADGQEALKNGDELCRLFATEMSFADGREAAREKRTKWGTGQEVGTAGGANHVNGSESDVNGSESNQTDPDSAQLISTDSVRAPPHNPQQPRALLAQTWPLQHPSLTQRARELLQSLVSPMRSKRMISAEGQLRKRRLLGVRLLGVLGRSASLEAELLSQRIQELQARKQELLRQQAALKNASAHPHDLEAIVTAAALTLTLLSGMLGGKATSGQGGGDNGDGKTSSIGGDGRSSGEGGSSNSNSEGSAC